MREQRADARRRLGDSGGMPSDARDLQRAVVDIAGEYLKFRTAGRLQRLLAAQPWATRSLTQVQFHEH